MTPSSNNILARLKSETRTDHENTEAISGAEAIMNHSISQEAYFNLLLKNLYAYKEVEAKIKPYASGEIVDKIHFLPPISKWILKDLKDALTQVHLESDIPFANKFEAIGAIYVLEGSLLGGAVIAKHVAECENLNSLGEQSFYSKEKKRISRWRKFMKVMNEEEFSEREKDDIIKGAKKAFNIFEFHFQKK